MIHQYDDEELTIPKDATVRIGPEVRGPNAYKPDYYKMSMDVLMGMSFSQAAEKYGLKSKQVSQNNFRLTVVNNIFRSRSDTIIEKGYDIDYLRDLWRNYLKS